MNDLQAIEPMSGGIDAQALIEKAIEKNLDIDKMERILAMRRELKQEFAREAYFLALSSFQKDCPVIEKKKVVFEKGSTTKARYKFAPLDDIVSQISETLEKYGFSYTIKTLQTKETVTAICFAHHKAGHFEQTEFTIPIDFTSYMSPAQQTAAALTYAKRYSFCDAFGIMTGDEDNDANTGDPEGKPDQAKNKKPADTGVNPKLAEVGKTLREWIKAEKVKFPEKSVTFKSISDYFMDLVTTKRDAEAIKYALEIMEAYKNQPAPVEIEKISEIFDGAIVETIPAEEKTPATEPESLPLF
jgi:uncharacterized protein YdhG (YjbR/CyaY superfamily)